MVRWVSTRRKPGNRTAARFLIFAMLWKRESMGSYSRQRLERAMTRKEHWNLPERKPIGTKRILKSWIFTKRNVIADVSVWNLDTIRYWIALSEPQSFQSHLRWIL